MEKEIDLKKEPQKKLSKVLIKWKSKENEIEDWRWKIGVNIFLLFSFGFFLWQKNYWGAGMTVLILFLIFIFQKQKIIHSFLIGEDGIQIDNSFLPFSDIKSFWIFENPPEILLKKKKGLSPYLSIPIKKEDKEKIEKIMENFLPKKSQKKKFLDTLAKKIGL